MEQLLLALPALLLVALVLVVHHHRRGRALDSFRRLARRRGGRSHPGAWYAMPYAELPLERSSDDDAAVLQLFAIAGGKNRRPQTLGWIAGPECAGLELELRRLPGRRGFLENLGWKSPHTGDQTFDAAFVVTGPGAEVAFDLCSPEVRRALLDVPREHTVRVRVGACIGYEGGQLVFDREEPRLEVSLRGAVLDDDALEMLVDVTTTVHRELRALGLADAGSGAGRVA